MRVMRCRPGTIALFSCWLGLATAGVSAQVPLDLSLSCAVPEGRGAPFDSSNLQQIRINVSLQAPKTLPGLAVEPNGSAPRTFWIEAREVNGGSNQQAAVKLSSIGGGETAVDRSLSVMVEIPIQGDLRDQQINDYLDSVLRAAEGGLLSADRLALFSQQRSVMSTSLRQKYSQSRVGDFELTCVYAMPDGAHELRSAPIPIKIRFEG